MRDSINNPSPINLTPTLSLSLPHWVEEFLKSYSDASFLTPESRMQFVVDLAERNIDEKTGGPFACAIFTQEKQAMKLVAIGTNLTVPLCDPTAHAEIVALRMAGHAFQNRRLKSDQHPAVELVVNGEPCGMCLNAINLAGISSLLIGATDEDLVSIGYGIGFKASDALDSLQKEGTEVRKGICRQQAVAVLKKYRQKI